MIFELLLEDYFHKWLKAANFCYKNLMLDTSKVLDPTGTVCHINGY